jgi:hypothetical protein
VPTSAVRYDTKLDDINTYRTLFFISLALIYKAVFIFSAFGFQMFSNYGAERLTDFGQSWVVVGHITTGLFIYYIKNKVDVKVLFLLLVLVVLSLSIGNRRDFAPVLIILLYFFMLRFQVRYTFPTLILTVAALNVFSFSSFFRNSTDSALVDVIISNEYVYPFYTLLPAVSKGFGTSDSSVSLIDYFLPFAMWIPRSLWVDKPESLAMGFVNSQSTDMGYAYMPLSEFVLLYGTAFFVPFFVFSLILAIGTKVRDTGVYLIILCMMPDICRGETQAIFFQFIFVYAAYRFAGVKYVSNNSYVTR